MKKVNRSEQIAEALIFRAVRLQRVASWLNREVRADLGQLRERLILNLIGPTPQLGLRFAHWFFLEVRNGLGEWFTFIMRSEEAFQAGLLNATPRPKNELPKLLGSSLAEWFEALEQSFLFKLNGAMSAHGQDPRGIPDLQKQIADGQFLEPLARSLESLIRSFVNRISVETLLELVSKVDSDLRWMQLSVLDNRTSMICQNYAFKEWDRRLNPIRHKLPFLGGPPRHFNCRSIVVPVFADDKIERQSLDDWLNDQTLDEREKLFGARNLKQWRKGQLSFSELIRQSNRPLSPEQLDA